MQISVMIKCDGAEDISFGEYGGVDVAEEKQKNSITNVEVYMDTIDNNVVDKADAMLAKVNITGVINKETNERIKQLFLWSLDNKENIYRDVTIILSDQKDIIRTYIFKRMFVVDYKEIINNDGNNKNSVFQLFLTQEENNLETIDTY